MTSPVDSKAPDQSSGPAEAFYVYALTALARIRTLRAEADQLATNLANRLSSEAPDLSAGLSYNDLVGVLRSLSEVVR